VGFVEAVYEGENHSVKPVNGFGLDAESQKARGKDIYIFSKFATPMESMA
jgi:hypothetical protein